MKDLREQVWRANIELVRQGLVVLTWGNVSGIDRARGIFLIKPSGVPYSELKPRHMVAVDLDGRTVEKGLAPSCDTPTHLELYRAFESAGGVVHAHSPYATAFAQAGRPIPCLGTTHADHFHGEVPLARMLTRKEVVEDYTGNTGKVIAERFAKLDPEAVPGVVVARHGPFAWGKDADDAVKNAVALEAVARIALATFALAPDTGPLPHHILRKHFSRKHGPGATYGQKKR